MGAVFSSLIWSYTSFIAVQVCASPTEPINSLTSVKFPEPTDPGFLFDLTVVPIPDHVLKQYGVFDNSPTNDFSSTSFDKRTAVLVCETSVDSPLEPDVQVLVEYLKKAGWNRSCKQIMDGIPYCTRLVSHGSASIGLCGPYQYQMQCRDVALEVVSICELCTRHINDDDRVGGIAIGVSRFGRLAPLFHGLIVYHNNELG